MPHLGKHLRAHSVSCHPGLEQRLLTRRRFGPSPCRELVQNRDSEGFVSVCHGSEDHCSSVAQKISTTAVDPSLAASDKSGSPSPPSEP